MLIPVGVRSLGMDKRTNTPVVILAESDGERIVPIWIGPHEASAIAMHLEDMTYDRPMTHDLVTSMIEAFGGTLVSVEVGKVEDQTYFATLRLRHGEKELAVDARPSDSIAVAIRMDAPLFVEERLLQEDTVVE